MKILLVLIAIGIMLCAPKAPAQCKIGRVISYRDAALQDPICKDEVELTTPTPVNTLVYSEFQGK